jgi:hypothetical protein
VSNRTPQVHHADERPPQEGKQVLVFRSARLGFSVLRKFGDQWRDDVGNVAAVKTWPYWMSLKVARHAFRSAFHHAGEATE